MIEEAIVSKEVAGAFKMKHVDVDDFLEDFR